MTGYDITITPSPLPSSSVAVLRSDTTIVARILISRGVGPKAGRLGGSCDCPDPSPCIHLLALRTVEGLESIESTKPL